MAVDGLADGSFWMDFEDFVQHFESLYCCRLFDKTWKVHQAKGEWKGKTG